MFSSINGGNPWQFQLQSLQQQLTQLQNQMTQPSLPQPQPMMQNMFQQPQPQIQAPAQPQIQPVNKSSVPIVHGNDGARSLASTMLPASSVVLANAQDRANNSEQSQYLLSVLGKFVPNAPATTA